VISFRCSIPSYPRRIYSVAIQSPAESFFPSSADEDSSEEEEEERKEILLKRPPKRRVSFKSNSAALDNKNGESKVASGIPHQKKHQQSVPVVPSATPSTSSFDLTSLRLALPSDKKMSEFDPSMY